MALVTTIGGASSDSFVSLADFKAYCDAQGLSYGDDDTALEQALRRATVYLCRSYSWRGYRTDEDQALCHPRTGLYDDDDYAIGSDEIAQGVIDAQCEMAYLIAGGTDPFATISTGAVVSKTERVDVISESTTYASGTERDRPAFPAVDQLIAPFVKGKAGSRGSMRAMRA